MNGDTSLENSGPLGSDMSPLMLSINASPVSSEARPRLRPFVPILVQISVILLRLAAPQLDDRDFLSFVGVKKKGQ